MIAQIETNSAVEALHKVRAFLDSVLYGVVNRRFMNDSLVPPFDFVQKTVKTLSRPYGILVALLRQGHRCDLDQVAEVIPPAALEAFLDSELLILENDEVRANGCMVVPVEGLYLAVSLPPGYPTCVDMAQPVYLGVDSLRLMSAVKLNLEGLDVLDVCSGSGVQGLLCAMRGARRVVLLEKSPVSVAFATRNAALNGLEEIVEVRQSDLFSALAPDEQFDYVTCNPPFMPVERSSWLPAAGAGGIGGAELLQPILNGLRTHMRSSGEGLIYCECLGDQYRVFFNERTLRPFALASERPVRAIVSSKTPIEDMRTWVSTVALNTRHAQGTRGAAEFAEQWLVDVRQAEADARYWYEQIIHIGKVDPQAAGLAQIAVYEPAKTDPLLRKIMGN